MGDGLKRKAAIKSDHNLFFDQLECNEAFQVWTDLSLTYEQSVTPLAPKLESYSSILNIAKIAARSAKSLKYSTSRELAALSLSLLKNEQPVPELTAFRRHIENLPISDRHYWIGTFYTLMLSTKIRKEQAAYFTPPNIADAVVDLAIEAGFDPGSHKVLDPAAGGAAFLSTIVGRRLQLGLREKDAIAGLHGYEIDPGLVAISLGLVADRVKRTVPRTLIEVRDSLSASPRATYDLVIANPPYGRITPSDLAHTRWEKVAHSGHINKYAVFADLALRATKPGGVVALLIPSSFRAGPLYDRLREHVRSQAEVLSIGTVASRDGIFADVAQDISVLVLRRGGPHPLNRRVSFPILGDKNAVVRLAKLPEDPKQPWPTPTASDRHVGGACLADYGVEARSGYFVWNREGDRLVEKASARSFPLLWAKNVKAGRLCMPAGKKGTKADFVTFESDSTAIIRSPAAILQRTTNDKQPRRLIAATVNPKVVKTWGGFVSENHTIVLTGKSLARLKLVTALLNTKAVDDRYRKVSGTASVSVTLLRTLDLPLPTRFETALKQFRGDAEIAARVGYGNTGLQPSAK